MKVRKITLKDIEFREVNGEFERIFINEKSYPVFLTNYALKRGKELGYIESSLFSNVIKLQGLEKLSQGKEEFENIDDNLLNELDETKMQQMIYLAFLGANKSSEMSFDEFITKYHDSVEQTMELYTNLISDLISSDPNQFAKAMQKSTNKSNKNGKKYNRRR